MFPIYILRNVTRDMSDEMILSRLIDQVGNKHIVSHWKVRRKCQQYHQCTTAMNKYTLVLHFIITSSPTTTTWSLFLNIAYAWIIVPCIFSFPSFLSPQDTILHKFLSLRIAATIAISSWGTKKFLCANYPTLLPALHLSNQDFYVHKSWFCCEMYLLTSN